MPWLQLKIHTEQQYVESISDWLMAHDSLSVSFEDAADQPLFEPPLGTTPLWSNTLITGLFESQVNIDSVHTKLTEQFADEIKASRSEILEDKDWLREWMSHYHPMQFADTLWIVPSHHSPPDKNAINILLDPGLAFGTGTHPTTAMCLTWLAKHPQNAKTVIDYGCGSGILAKLGAKQVYAIDNDPQALLATTDNALKNQVSEQIQCRDVEIPLTKQPDSQPLRADTLVANILAGPLIELAERFSKIVRPGGNIVLSGILQEQAEQVSASYQPWFSFENTLQQEDWILLQGTRHNDI